MSCCCPWSKILVRQLQLANKHSCRGGGGHCLVQMEWCPAGWLVSASVNLPLHHKVQKFSGNGSPGWSWKKGCKMVVVWWWWWSSSTELHVGTSPYANDAQTQLLYLHTWKLTAKENHHNSNDCRMSQQLILEQSLRDLFLLLCSGCLLSADAANINSATQSAQW